MNLNPSIYKGVLTAMLLGGAAFASVAQSVDILGITNDGQRAQLKAKVELAGKTPASVTTYSYNMTDGFTVTNTAHEFVTDGVSTYLTADVYYYDDVPGYTYRVVVSFTDGTSYTSEVVNRQLTEAFMWLGDFKYAAGESGWDAAHPPCVDREIDPTLQFMLDGTRYYKGIDNHARGYVVYTFDKPEFTRFVTKYGVQDDRSEGDVTFSFYTGSDASRTDASQLMLCHSQDMYSMTNPNRGDRPCAADLDIDMTGCTVLRVNYDICDSDNHGDHGHLAMARLYMPVDHPSKTAQEVSFATPGGELTDAVTLKASATSGGKIFYRIISGRDLATIDGDVLTPVWGTQGTIVVEATQYGDDEWYPSTDYQTFTVNLEPTVTLLDVYRPSVPASDGHANVYALVDTRGRALDKLSVAVYGNPTTLVKQTEINLLGSYSPSAGRQVIEIPVPAYDTQILSLSYSYVGDDTVVTLPYWHGEGYYDYISDFPTSYYTYGMGWTGTFGINAPYNATVLNNGVLEIGTGNVSYGVYAKGFGIHATGFVDVAAEHLAPYDRVVVDMGASKHLTNNYATQKLTFQILNGNSTLAEAVDLPKNQYVHWDYNFNNHQNLRLVGNQGSDGNGNDYVCFGAPRLYYIRTPKSAQTINWQSERRIVGNGTTEIALDASSSSGMDVRYYIVKGSQYATLRGNTLVINTLPNGGDEVIVDAYQPGDDSWAPAPVVSCSFTLVHGLEVQKNEYVELSGPDTLDELIIHADSSTAGEINVKSGIVNVKTLILKYTFTPDQWAYVSFPSDLNIDRISDLGRLGYNYNAYSGPSYYIRECDTDLRALDPDSEGWKDLDTPDVKANKGYIMTVDGSLSTEPVEVTFTIDNANVDLSEIRRAIGLTVDFSGMRVGSTQNVSITATNPDVISNHLTVEVTFSPTDTSNLPVDHAYALDKLRYTFVNGHKAIRLTLPDQTPARVVFFDSKGEKVVKAVRYISPNVIDLRDLKAGKYNMMVGYGPATKAYEIEI